MLSELLQFLIAQEVCTRTVAKEHARNGFASNGQRKNSRVLHVGCTACDRVRAAHSKGRSDRALLGIDGGVVVEGNDGPGCVRIIMG